MRPVAASGPAVVAGWLLVAALLAPGASASVRCNHSPNGELRVVPYVDPHIDLDFADGTVLREGRRVVVLGSLDEEVKCKGAPATVANTGSILFLQGELSFNTLDLSGGLPAPHVEFRTELGALGFGIVRAGESDDVLTLGGSPKAVTLSPDPSSPEAAPIVWDGLGENVPTIEGGPGNDTIDASAVARRHANLLLLGGPGDDTLVGSPFEDELEGGPGRDRLAGAAGNDTLDGRDRSPDRLDCGPGHRDKARPGRGDSTRGCEIFQRPVHRHPGSVPVPPAHPTARR